MKAKTFAIAVCVALALTALPAVVPAAEILSPVADAQARPGCIIGSGDCIIPVYCVMEPCWQFP